MSIHSDEPRTNKPLAIWRDIRENSPSVLVSIFIHILLLGALALWVLPDVGKMLDLNLAVSLSEDLELDTEDFLEVETGLKSSEELSDVIEQPDTDVVEEEISFSEANDLEAASLAAELYDFGEASAPIASNALNGFDGTGMTGRGHMARAAMVRQGGGNADSESAVAAALQWLANHQLSDGSWSFDHRRARCQCRNPGDFGSATRAATAMALLPFLGAGQTHKQGKYRKVIKRGLDALVRQMKITPGGGSFLEPKTGKMYSHGLATIALCEAYGMTKDRRLREPAQLALNFISYAQSPVDGGWRYKVHEAGDTSVTGWQIMALKSGMMAGLRVSSLTTLQATSFFDKTSFNNGQQYHYTTASNAARKSLDAVGLLSRMYLGWDQEKKSLKNGIGRLAKLGPSENDYYFNYYATQVLFQNTNAKGPQWEKWNRAMRNQLIKTQGKKGHEKGSWYGKNSSHSAHGGRLYKTALAAMTLEVYYRYMPIYQSEAFGR